MKLIYPFLFFIAYSGIVFLPFYQEITRTPFVAYFFSTILIIHSLLLAVFVKYGIPFIFSAIESFFFREGCEKEDAAKSEHEGCDR